MSPIRSRPSARTLGALTVLRTAPAARAVVTSAATRPEDSQKSGKGTRMKFRTRLGSAVFVTLLAACTGEELTHNNASSALSADAVVLQWNEIAVQAVGPTPPFPSTRAMATVQVAVFEAVNAITHRYTPYLGTVTAADGASTDAAVIVAAHDTLVWLFPAQAAMLDTERDASLLRIPDGQAKDYGKAAGAAAAAAMIANRTGDGSAPAQFWTPPNTDPYEWQPTPSCASFGGRGAFLHWRNVKPFGVDSSAQFRAEPPPELVDGNYANDFHEVHDVGDVNNSTQRPQDRADVAKLYAALPPHRGWNLVARQIASTRSDEVTATARTLAVMNMSLSDAHITVFESKYLYRTWRPETAIPRAGEDGNQRTDPDPFNPFITTPCFPGYPSAHGAGGGAARVVLERAYGRKGHDLTVTDAGAPGIVLHYTDLHDITDDVSDARVFGGIHFRYDQDAGNKMGEDIGRYNDDNRLTAVFGD